jgi:hypothetical protein
MAILLDRQCLLHGLTILLQELVLRFHYNPRREERYERDLSLLSKEGPLKVGVMLAGSYDLSQRFQIPPASYVGLSILRPSRGDQTWSWQVAGHIDRRCLQS